MRTHQLEGRKREEWVGELQNMACPTLIAINFHLIICLGLSHKFYLGPHYSGCRITIRLTEDAGPSQNTLWPAIFEKGKPNER